MDTFYINLVLRLQEQKAKSYGLEVKPLSCRGVESWRGKLDLESPERGL